MKLTDLNPKWVTLGNWSLPATPFYIAVSFDCPCELCRQEPCAHCGHKPHSQRQMVKFWPPIDPFEVAKSFAIPLPKPDDAFDRIGDSFDELTINPPINIKDHWQGRIINGEVLHGYE